MSKFFVNENQVKEDEIVIIGDDVNHIKNVLRYNVSDEITICANGINYLAEIKEFYKDNIVCKINEKIDKELAESNVNITIFQGLPKADKMELIIQKGTELGVSEFVPVKFERSVVKLSGKDEEKKIERWQKIAEVAAKQCGRDIIPKIKNVNNIENVCKLIEKYDIVLLAYENETENFLKHELVKIKGKKNYNIGIVIGPEGGISEFEVNKLKENGAKVISLGKRILRTETVCLAMSSIIMYELGDIGGNCN